MISLPIFFSNKPIPELSPGYVLFCVSCFMTAGSDLVRAGPDSGPETTSFSPPLTMPSQCLYNAFMLLTGLRNNHERRVEAATASELGKRSCREQSSLLA